MTNGGSKSSRALKTVKGMRDLLPPETAVWSAVEEVARRVFATYGYGEIRTPVVEETELFVRGVGEATDIVGKEMYTFPDKKGRSLTLRPENTAAVARAFVEHRMDLLPAPVKLFYIGPQFRYERPQAGRYRQFFQIGAELLGQAGPEADVEVIAMLVRFLGELGFDGLSVLVNTVGDEASRAAYREALVAYLAPRAERLGEDSRRRLGTNPLRILDTKDPAERELLADAPRLADHLTAESRDHFARVVDGLGLLGVPYRLDERLVRGLDYYTHTVFEIVAVGLGAQNAICGGGRYDKLIADLGGPEVAGVGFAIGEDRLLEILPASFRERAAPPPPILVAAGGEADPRDVLALGERLRDAGVPVLVDVARSLKSALRASEKRGVRLVAIVNGWQRAEGQLAVKDLALGEQQILPTDAALALLVARARERQA